MAKFFDINKKSDSDANDAPETVTRPVVEKDDKEKTDDLDKEINQAIEHGSYADVAEKDEKPDAGESENQKSDTDDTPPKAPEIPRATEEMAPATKSKEEVLPPQSIVPPVIKASKGQKFVTAILSIILIVLLGLLVSQAVIFFNNNQKTASTTTTESPSATVSSASPSATTQASPSTTATASPSATGLTKSSISVQVLNGSGITGAAAKVTTVIQNAGFTVSSTANAKSYSYQSTYVYYNSESQKDLADEIVAALTGYTVTAKIDTSMATSATQITVVVGKK